MAQSRLMTRTSYCWQVKPQRSSTSRPIALFLFLRFWHTGGWCQWSRSCSRDNDIGIPYILMSKAHGSPLRYTWKTLDLHEVDISRGQKAKVVYRASISTLFWLSWITLWGRGGILHQDLFVLWPVSEWTIYSRRYTSWTFQVWQGILHGTNFGNHWTRQILSSRSSLLFCAHHRAEWV